MNAVWFVERKLEGETDYVPVGFPEITRKGARKQRDDIRERHPKAPLRLPQSQGDRAFRLQMPALQGVALN